MLFGHLGPHAIAFYRRVIMRRQRGIGYSGKDSTRPTQPQEGDLANAGGTRAGGTVGFMVPAASQWGVSDQDAAATLSQGHPKSRKVPLGHGFEAHDDANVTGGFGSAK